MPSRRRAGLVVGLVALIPAVAACSDDPAAVPSTSSLDVPTTPVATVPVTTPPAPTGFDVDPIVWESLSDSIDRALVTVPVDYDDPQGATIDLMVARHRATDPTERIGSLLVNPGGPGTPGTDLVLSAEAIYGPELLARFDIVGWDPRGTGLSELAVRCIDDVDVFFAERPLVPVGEAEVQAAVDRWSILSETCESRNPVMWDRVGTNNSARDMDVIRRALGEETISYFGFSYGTLLGGTWATLFPDTVRAAVLDGAANPDTDVFLLEQAAGLERSLELFLQQCSDDPQCAFHSGGDAPAAFDQMMIELTETPVPTEPGRLVATRMLAKWAVMQAMYSDTNWPTLADALAAASQGDGSGLLGLLDVLLRRQPDGSFPNTMDALLAINCADQPYRSTFAEVAQRVTTYTEVSPRFFPDGAVDNYYCSYFPPAQDPRVDITGTGAGPILVVGVTGDPYTPLVSSQAMVDALEDGHLLTVEANQHTGYTASDCAKRVVADYLIDLVLPEEGTRCE